jgi:stearoyl-CoA desaturase (delta-9 desaturase)
MAQDEPRPSAYLSIHMSRAHRIANLVAVLLPFAAFLAAVVLLWNEAVGWLDLALLVGFYAVTCLGVTVGYHRMLTHRAFETSPRMRTALAAVGSMAVEGPVITWVADHRKHHAFTDEDGDPHSPHTGHGGGVLGAAKGLFHAHMGWMFKGETRADADRFARDLVRDPGIRWVNRTFLLWTILSLALPFALGWLIGGSLAAGLTGLLWGGAVRIFLLHHVTWSINSVCHFFGRRRFETDDESRNVFWLSILSCGESWHHNHHAFPTSAFHGLRRWEVDPSALVIRGLEKLGLVWNVVRISPERQQAKEAVQGARQMGEPAPSVARVG